jgi:hypothetical protein
MRTKGGKDIVHIKIRYNVFDNDWWKWTPLYIHIFQSNWWFYGLWCLTPLSTISLNIFWSPYILHQFDWRGRCGHDCMVVELPVQSVPITTKVVSLNHRSWRGIHVFDNDWWKWIPLYIHIFQSNWWFNGLWCLTPLSTISQLWSV